MVSNSNSNLEGCGHNLNAEILSKHSRMGFLLFRLAGSLPLLCPDPTLRMADLREWGCPISTSPSCLSLCSQWPWLSDTPAWDVQPRSDPVRVLRSTLFYLNKSHCAESSFFTFPGLLGPTFMPGTAQWGPLAATTTAGHCAELYRFFSNAEPAS